MMYDIVPGYALTGYAVMIRETRYFRDMIFEILSTSKHITVYNSHLCIAAQAFIADFSVEHLPARKLDYLWFYSDFDLW